MVYLLEEYVESARVSRTEARMLTIFQTEDQMLHTMSLEDIKNKLQTRSKSFHSYKTSLLKYLNWLKNKLDGPEEKKVSNLIYNLAQLKSLGIVGNNQLFSSFSQMLTALNDQIDMIEKKYSKNYDIEAIKAIYVLEWYGLCYKDIVSIQLTNIHPDSNEIYVPSQDENIILSDESMKIILEYKDKLGLSNTHIRVIGGQEHIVTSSIRTYKQQTLVRTTINKPITERNCFLIVRLINDERFKYGRVIESGIYSKLQEIEIKNNILLVNSSPDFIEEKVKHKGISFARFQLYKERIQYERGHE